MPEDEEQVNKHWGAALGSLFKEVTSHIATWAVIGLLGGWLGHSAMGPDSIHMDMEKLTDQVLLVNVKLGAMVEAMPPPQRQRTMDLINQRLAVLALAGKPTQP